MNKIQSLIFTSLVLLFIPAGCKVQKGITTTRKPQNIILIIGDGMGATQMYAAMTVSKKTLNVERCHYIGFSKTSSASDYITDSGAGGTAISTGYKTYNGAIGVDKDSIPRKTILEYAELNGLSTGLVATSTITHATPASFISHVKNRNSEEAIALDFLNCDIDVFVGGGRKMFASRTDHLNLLDSLKNRGYSIFDRAKDALNSKAKKIVCLTALEHNPPVEKGRGDMLLDGTLTAINTLKNNKKGFFLMVEGSQIDWGNHANNARYVVSEVLDMDKSIGAALDFAQKNGNTLVIITADHESGGMTVLGFDEKADTIKAAFSTKGHTPVMVPVYAFGPGAEEFTGIYENTALFEKMMKLYGFKR
jgi:alkaline phosphatase